MAVHTKQPRSHHSKRSFSRISELDGAIHVRRHTSAKLPVHPVEVRGVSDESRQDESFSTIDSNPIPPSHQLELLKFEQKYRDFVATSYSYGDASARIDDLYHEHVIHMGDGVPMNRAALKNLYRYLLSDGRTTRRVEEFIVIDDTHVQSVIHTRNKQLDLFVKACLTLKDGKIIRVEKFESAAGAA